jgi:chromosomal replication initiator protein
VATLEQTIAQRIGQPRYRLWFDGKTKFNWDDRQLVVGVPNRFYQEWLEKTFAHAVRTAADMVLGQPMQVRFAIDPQLYQSSRIAQIEEPDRGSNGTSEEQARALPPPRESASQERPAKATKRIRRWRRLEDFVVGPCNRLAHAAALSVVESPGFAANPLVLYGPIGTGKTHLLEGIRSGLHRADPESDICYVTAEEFTNRFLYAMKAGQMPGFRKRFRECDVLLLDDLHFLANKRVTQEEFVNTFDALLAEGKQIVVSCDCHPRLEENLLVELTDRLLGGPIWGLEPPDAATRLIILQAKSARNEGRIPEDVLHLLASHLRGNVRELEGALHSVRHYSLVTGRPIDVNLAREAIADLLRHSVRVVQLADIDRQLCQVLRLDGRALQGKQRSWAVSHPRMVAMYLARKHTSSSYSEIGQYFGGRNHSTVVAAEKKVRQLLDSDGELMLGDRRLRLGEVIDRVERDLQR